MKTIIEEFVDVEQISKMLNVNPKTVKRWIREGYLKAEKTSNRTGNTVSIKSLYEFVEDKHTYRMLLAAYDIDIILHGKVCSDELPTDIKERGFEIIAKKRRCINVLEKEIATIEYILSKL